jgi:hypothetical protein
MDTTIEKDTYQGVSDLMPAANEVVVLDAETEVTGYRPLEDSKRIISIQLAGPSEAQVYYVDSPDPRYNLDSAKSELERLTSQGFIVAGFNIKRFDMLILEKFLGVALPQNITFELMDHPRVASLKGKRTLEVVCKTFGIDVSHKERMNERIELFKRDEGIIARDKLAAPSIMKERRRTPADAYDDALRSIAIGSAIYASYTEFLNNGHRKDSLFYEYALGDAICERQLFNLLSTLSP